MRKFVFLAMLLMATVARGEDVSPFAAAMVNVRASCGGISGAMAHLKTMAGINTAVSAVGTVAGGVGLGVGIAKVKKDKELDEVEAFIAKYKNAPSYPDNPEFNPIDWDAVEKQARERLSAQNGISDGAAVGAGMSLQEMEARRDELLKKSTMLGNVRTGALATSAATNIAGAVISGTNKIDDALDAKIGACRDAVDALSRALGQARVDGSADATSIATADKIISACGGYDTVDLAKINKRAGGGMISSAIGAGTALAGTATSVMANSDKVRNGDAAKEKNLNMASNVLAGATTVASGAATIFNATQISAIKKMADVADECEGALR